MSLRHILLIGSLAMVLGGCVVAPHPHRQDPYYDRDYYYSDDDYYDYQATPSYAGYYYVRVIFIDNIPFYVGDDRHVRPIPRHLHDHFRNSPFRNKDRRAPVFNRDSEVRDGYQMSRVIYYNNMPYYVEDGRAARPMPSHVQERFRYSPFNQNGGNNGRNDRQLPMQRRNEPPAYGREQERNEPPAYGRERDRNEPPTYGRERDRNEPPTYGREQERMTPPRYENQQGNGGFNQPQRDEPRGRPNPFRNNGDMSPPNGRTAQPQREERGNPAVQESRPAPTGRQREERRPQSNRKQPAPNKSRGNGEDEKDNGSRRERAFR